MRRVKPPRAGCLEVATASFTASIVAAADRGFQQESKSCEKEVLDNIPSNSCCNKSKISRQHGDEACQSLEQTAPRSPLQTSLLRPMLLQGRMLPARSYWEKEVLDNVQGNSC